MGTKMGNKSHKNEEWRAPEIVKAYFGQNFDEEDAEKQLTEYAQNYNFKVDIWGFGIIAASLLIGRSPFSYANDIKLIDGYTDLNHFIDLKQGKPGYSHL
jgi:serine/threonine protein kinase